MPPGLPQDHLKRDEPMLLNHHSFEILGDFMVEFREFLEVLAQREVIDKVLLCDSQMVEVLIFTV